MVFVRVNFQLSNSASTSFGGILHRGHFLLSGTGCPFVPREVGCWSRNTVGIDCDSLSPDRPLEYCPSIFNSLGSSAFCRYKEVAATLRFLIATSSKESLAKTRYTRGNSYHR